MEELFKLDKQNAVNILSSINAVKNTPEFEGIIVYKLDDGYYKLSCGKYSVKWVIRPSNICG